MKAILCACAAAGLATAASASPRYWLETPPATTALQIGLRDESAAVRLAAVRASARAGNVEAVPYLSAVLLRLDEPPPLRAAAVLALGRIGDWIAVGALGEALMDPDPEIRSAAALSLGLLPADGVAQRLERTLRSDSEWEPRFAAAIALGRMPKEIAAEALSQALVSDPAWQVRQQAARSLQDLGTSRAAELLAAVLKDEEGPSARDVPAPAARRARRR